MRARHSYVALTRRRAGTTHRGQLGLTVDREQRCARRSTISASVPAVDTTHTAVGFPARTACGIRATATVTDHGQPRQPPRLTPPRWRGGRGARSSSRPGGSNRTRSAAARAESAARVGRTTPLADAARPAAIASGATQHRARAPRPERVTGRAAASARRRAARMGRWKEEENGHHRLSGFTRFVCPSPCSARANAAGSASGAAPASTTAIAPASRGEDAPPGSAISTGATAISPHGLAPTASPSSDRGPPGYGPCRRRSPTPCEHGREHVLRMAGRQRVAEDGAQHEQSAATTRGDPAPSGAGRPAASQAANSASGTRQASAPS